MALGVFLCLASWFAWSHAASWNAVIVGAAIAVAACFAIAKQAIVPEWINVALGAWLWIAPWMLDFSIDASAVWAHLLVGIFVVYFAGMQIVFLKRPETTRRAFRAINHHPRSEADRSSGAKP